MRDALEKWHAYAANHDAAALWDALHPDAIFESPVVHTPQRGREITHAYLSAALKVLGNQSFRYVGEWRAPRSAVLEFETEVDGIRINGVDMISWNDANQITHFKVMVRPLKAINLLHQMMAAQLQKG